MLKSKLLSDNNVVRDYSSTKTPYSPDEFDTPSPYKRPGPRDYGFETKLRTGGMLARGVKNSRLKYKPKNNWSSEKALFGQNDYIDILGDENIRPVDLIQGPKWVVGFNGNELQRISRRLRLDGKKLKLEKPTVHKNLNKRLWYLYKKYNSHRVSKYK
ncbi:hypothetical protein LOTGIDRAFT_153781 [Lottia gigantea]|uniref:Large ribosomal subunit protein mL51 n=1 Tax=Lottia gigantea TaxID=225164 RepID=V4ADG4_LOTGI|nr:hypothetical protein LOTGIDRAFT_153781 [Lottia gigantea]ESO91346.1 hypothetical protein LOTGIDRAFT_153781 [Lottia gigantea]